jgi:hypothetical protein
MRLLKFAPHLSDGKPISVATESNVGQNFSRKFNMKELIQSRWLTGLNFLDD